MIEEPEISSVNIPPLSLELQPDSKKLSPHNQKTSPSSRLYSNSRKHTHSPMRFHEAALDPGRNSPQTEIQYNAAYSKGKKIELRPN